MKFDGMLDTHQGPESPIHAWFCLLLSFCLLLISLPFLDQFSHLLLPLVCDHCPSLAGAAQLYGQVEACALSSPPDPPGERDQKRLGSGQSGGCPRPRLSVSWYIQWVAQRGLESTTDPSAECILAQSQNSWQLASLGLLAVIGP